MASDESTAAISLSDEGAFLKSTWELTLIDPQGQERHFPVYRTVLKVPPVEFTMKKGQLHFESPVDLIHRREPVRKGVLGVGETLNWEGGELALHDRSGKARATMECFTDPFYSRIWTLDQKVVRMGRPGKRKNEMEVDHPTISREHAVLNWEPQGPVLTSSGVTLVEGKPVSQVALSDGALVQLGDLLFQFRLLSVPSVAQGALRVTSLGSFQVSLDGELVTEKAWRTQAVRWMLARLALEWGRPVAAERLLDEFWPEMPEERSRNNFNYTISTLRQVLGRPDAILRATGSLQLAPGFLGEHDLVVLQRALRSEDWATAVDVYGEYLPGCYMDWADTVRGHLEQQTLQGGLRLLERYESAERWAEAIALGGKLHGIDGTCQRTCLGLLRAHLGRGGSAEAVRVYERFREHLRAELAMEPAADLMALYERARDG